MRIRHRNIAAFLAALAVGAFLYLHWDYIGKQVEYASGPVPTEAPAAKGEKTVTPDRLWIPVIGLVDVPIVHVTERKESAYQAALQRGVGHFPGTAAVGRPGNAYLFGHSSDYASADGEFKTVFALLPKLQPGDRIVASDGDGRAFEYAVTETFVIAPDDFSVLDQFGNERTLLTLQTSYPLGTALRRYIVRATLVAPETESAAR